MAEEITDKSATIGGASPSHHILEDWLEVGKLGPKQVCGLVVLQGGSAESLNDKGVPHSPIPL